LARHSVFFKKTFNAIAQRTMYITYMEDQKMNFIDTLEQDKETSALDALEELAQKDSAEAKTIEEDATEAWFALEQAWALDE
jgi:hypothetical protein